jgi:kynureninase
MGYSSRVVSVAALCHARISRIAVKRDDCIALDENDALAGLRGRFALPPGIVYLDGNSLGPLPRHVSARISNVVDVEWGAGLIGSWNDAAWIDAPRRTGARIARLIGAGDDEVVVGDSTSINLFKLLAAAVRLRPGRRVLLTDRGNFPTDLYIVDAVAQTYGLDVIRIDPDALAGTLDARVAAVALSHVDYRTGRIHPMGELSAAAHEAGALVVWDLSHSAGAIPVELDAAEADFAVGCGYKYLNGGPGAPAFSFAARGHHATMHQPLTGWLGHARPFAFAASYEPAPGVGRLSCGTPPIISLLALESALDVFADVDLAALARKGRALGDLFIRCADEALGQYGFVLVSPRDGRYRGNQVSLAHPHGYAIVRALIARGVVGDFRAPDVLRFGFAPLYTRYVDAFDAAEAIAAIMDTGEWKEAHHLAPKSVT